MKIAAIISSINIIGLLLFNLIYQSKCYLYSYLYKKQNTCILKGIKQYKPNLILVTHREG